MAFRLMPRRRAGLVTALLASGALIAGALVATGSPAQAATAAPCDIYASAGTPCVAAHSMTRALFSAYNGPLYKVTRWSDSTSTNISTLAAGGYANGAAQDSFCAGSSCTVTEIYDQTTNHNNLTIEGPGGNGGQDFGANAAALPITVAGHKVYGLYVSAGVGYRDNTTTGIATGHQPEGEYMIASGTHVNNRCCFDYGNAETSSDDTGNGHMDAINFGTEPWFSPTSGTGPWVQADLENGLFQGGNGAWAPNTGRNSTFVTAMLKNDGTIDYAIKDGNAQSGALATRYSGALPNTGGYAPMSKEGAIVLGTGGDDSDGSVGSFFEGVMTSGYPSDATDNAVQANIVAVRYQTAVTFPGAGDTYKITSVDANKVLDAVNCGTGNDTSIDINTDLGTACQQWAFNSAANGSWTVTNVNSGKVVDAMNCGKADGTATDLYSALGNNCQEFEVIPTGGSNYQLVVENSGMVLDNSHCNTAKSNPVDLYQWEDNTCQEWTLTKVG